jgi:hypothetical protein
MYFLFTYSLLRKYRQVCAGKMIKFATVLRNDTYCAYLLHDLTLGRQMSTRSLSSAHGPAVEHMFHCQIMYLEQNLCIVVRLWTCSRTNVSLLDHGPRAEHNCVIVRLWI